MDKCRIKRLIVNSYLEVKEKDRVYYEVYSLPRSEEVPEGYKELSFVCLRPDGAFEAPSTVGIMCRTARKRLRAWKIFISTCAGTRMSSPRQKIILCEGRNPKLSIESDSLRFLFY